MVFRSNGLYKKYTAGLVGNSHVIALALTLMMSGRPALFLNCFMLFTAVACSAGAYSMPTIPEKREMRRQQKQLALSRPDVDEKIISQFDIKGPDCIKELLAPKLTIYVIALQRLNVGNALRIEKALLMSVRSVTPIVNFIFDTLPAPS